ncbi:hypothetical protein OIDMADRAFT_141358 [Oidiodendron maius Zn]|uniref:Carbohydrate-binding module family 18 protein n=1 Tax=Oidiodendron maius (strain Zn) TaxID=913774 RepID=A0A0C3HRL2_OIDMZ|nr:hypothetical protein OIDMADRAFT_141358 [Oidiodendron maius Zn]
MQLTSRLLSLPASILFLITAHTAIALRNDRLPSSFSDAARRLAEPADQRNVEARNEQTPLSREPVGVMKMSDDPSQKFYLHYWQYEEDLPQSNTSDVPPARPLRIRDAEEEAILMANASAVISYRTPFALHTKENLALHHLEARGRIPSRGAAAAALSALQKRQFECPTGTNDCTSIGYPNSCCATNETCFQIQDTGLGPVGCCPDGDNCGGTISGCNSPNTPCAENSSADYEGGGCCIPGFVCAGIGCIPSSSASSEGTAQTSTVVVTVTPSTSSTTTSTSTTTTSSQASVVTITQTATGNAPARLTGSTSISSTPVTTEPAGSCPTGFYACEAYNAGGCCRTGRNCDTTDCPPTSSTTIVSGSETIVVPVGPAATLYTPTGNCASGWSSCAASLGGNCCLSGWQCGTASCTSISATSTAVGEKEAPSMGVRSVQVYFGLLICCMMIVLMWI